MLLDLYYFNEETNQVVLKKCNYDHNSKNEVFEDKSFDFDMENVMVEMIV